MRARIWALTTASLFTLVASAALAADDTQNPSVFVYAQGGGINSADHFDPLRSADFKTGLDLSGGIGVQLNRYVAVRGSFGYARSRGQDLDFDVANFDGMMFNRYIYSGDVQVGYPLAGGVTPYVLAGGGAMTFSNRTDLTQPNFTRGFGKGGAGVSFQIPNSPVAVFVQGTGLLYKVPTFDPNRTLFDVTWTGGLRVRL